MSTPHKTHPISGVISKASGWMPMGQMLTLIKRPLYSMRLGYDSRPRILQKEEESDLLQT